MAIGLLSITDDVDNNATPPKKQSVNLYREQCQEKTVTQDIYRKKSFAVAAFEAGFMIWYPFKRHHINHIHSLVTSLAFIQSSCKCHSYFYLFRQDMKL
jgi:hypothetical protein